MFSTSNSATRLAHSYSHRFRSILHPHTTPPPPFVPSSHPLSLPRPFALKSVATRTSTLRWFLMLHLKMPGQIFEHIDEFAPSLLKALSDPADKVVLLALEVLAEISSTQSEDLKDQATAFFDRFTVDLMTIFRLGGGERSPPCSLPDGSTCTTRGRHSNDRNLLEARGPFIVRQLCVLLEAEKIYRAFAGENRVEASKALRARLEISFSPTSSKAFFSRKTTSTLPSSWCRTSTSFC